MDAQLEFDKTMQRMCNAVSIKAAFKHAERCLLFVNAAWRGTEVPEMFRLHIENCAKKKVHPKTGLLDCLKPNRGRVRERMAYLAEQAAKEVPA
jgi:hypothetical protein